MLCLTEARRKQEQKTHLYAQLLLRAKMHLYSPRFSASADPPLADTKKNFQLMLFGVLIVNLTPHQFTVQGILINFIPLSNRLEIGVGVYKALLF